MQYILAIDQGTTSSRAILFDKNMQVAGIAQQEVEQIFPQSGWVEHNPAEIWETVLKTCRDVISSVGITASDIAGIGITNQRETTIVWDKTTGKPIHNAIVWQDRRTAGYCQSLREAGHEEMVTQKTGLLLDPYFSGTKLKWLLENVETPNRENLLFGTVDSFLIWKLTGNHLTDATNAARTLMYDIRKGHWSSEICDLLDIPMEMLPEVKDCAADFGTVPAEVFGAEIPILGVAGDQQAATIGQACFDPGMMKSTYGTGCFALLNTGEKLVRSKNRMLGTIAYQLDGVTTYALEGSIFIAGAVVQWLRDGLEIVSNASETQAMAEAADPTQSVVIVPAFTGLGAPYWNAECRGAIYGLTRNSGPAEFARAALESVGFQTRDLLEAMMQDWDGVGKNILRVDGGMSANNWAMQFLSDIIDAKVDRPAVLETTALGAAWLAGMRAGIYPDQAGFAKTWALQQQFSPEMSQDTRETKYSGWKRAINATLNV